jgi:hypothetical protein
MNNVSFARQLSAWIDPWMLSSAALESPDSIREESVKYFQASNLKTASQAGLDRLVNAFLGNFRLTEEFLTIFKNAGSSAVLSEQVRSLLQIRSQPVGTPDPYAREVEKSVAMVGIIDATSRCKRIFDISDDLYDSLKGLRFSGKVYFSDFDAQCPRDTVFSLLCSKAELCVLSGPLHFLTAFVNQLTELWSQMHPQRAFYEPSYHTELAVYIEAIVARCLGFDVRSAARVKSGAGGAVNHRPIGAVVTMVGGPPYRRQAAIDIQQVAWQRSGPSPQARPIPVHKERPANLCPDDGFVLLNPKQVAKPWRNIERFLNECSPFSMVELPAPREDGKVLVDSYYGRAFDFEISENAAVYGLTQDLDRSLHKHPMVFGCLRIPYRCVPRIKVRSRMDIESIIQDVIQKGREALGSPHVLLRGQTQEYYIQRSPEARLALYGDSAALEPSFTASAVRRKQPLERIFPEWCFLIRTYVMALGAMVIARDGGAEPKVFDFDREVHRDAESARMDWQRLGLSLDNHTLGFSLAQHYGLPSMGLDLTDNVGVALFFALREMQKVEGRRLRVSENNKDSAVIYIFLLPERFCVEHTRSRPSYFPRGRPDHQDAWFSHMGWAHKHNQCAEYLAAALYLDKDGDYGTIPSAEQLFPGEQDDEFGSFLEDAIQKKWGSRLLQRYLKNLYWAE